jgi:NAD(P)-dependent dehydrogenase (short-subunit alcohol dehydrogenase family)
VDTRDHDGLKSAVDDAVGILGRLDIIVANAGITPRAWNAITPEEFRDVMDVNVTGTWNSVMAAHNTSSTAATAGRSS